MQNTLEECTTALKKAIAENREILLLENEVIIGNTSYRKDSQTRYTNQRGVPYSLGCIAHLYHTKNIDHGVYIRQCKEKKIDPVSFIDRERLLADIYIAPVTDHIKTSIPFRSDLLSAKELYQRYIDDKKSKQTGIEYIVIPPAFEQDIERFLSILKSNGQAFSHLDGTIKCNSYLYKVVSTHKEISSLDRLAAVFIDGGTGQFRDWPKEIIETMKTIPVFYLLDERENRPLPSLPLNTTILKTNNSKISFSLISRAFWSILGHKVQ